MPVPPPFTAAPYDNLESVLNLSRTRFNDAIASIGGEILTDTQPFTATMVNSAWRRLQAQLCNLGYSKYKRKWWGYGLPAVASQDPSSETFWSWTQYFDGVAYYTAPVVPLLPQDMIAPLVIKERQSGNNQPFSKMMLAPDGLRECRKRPWNGQFEWKNDAIYMPGSTFSMDFEIEYAAYDYDFVSTNGVLGNPATTPPTTPFNMQVPIMRCQSAFANYVCVECAKGRDDVDVPQFLAEAEQDAKLLMNNSDVKLKQRHPVQRRAYAGRGRGQLWGTQGY